MTGLVDKPGQLRTSSVGIVKGNQIAHLSPPSDRIELFRSIIGSEQFSRADYLRHFKDISTATASRDLKQATAVGTILKTGNGRLTVYSYV